MIYDFSMILRFSNFSIMSLKGTAAWPYFSLLFVGLEGLAISFLEHSYCDSSGNTAILEDSENIIFRIYMYV